MAKQCPNDDSALLKVILDTVHDGIIVIDRDGLIRVFNPAAERTFGYLESEVIGEAITTLMPEPARSKHDGYMSSYLRTGEAKVIGIGREVLGLRKDQSTFPMEINIGEMVIDGEPLFTGVVRDITDRKGAEAKSERLIEAMDALPGYVSMYDEQDRLVFTNKQFRKINRKAKVPFELGTTFEAHQRRALADHVVPEAVGREEEWLVERHQRRKSPTGPFELKRSDGVHLLIEDHTLESGGLISLATDIQDQKDTEALLRASEEKISLILKSAGDGIFGVDHEGLVSFANPAACEMLGRTENNLLGQSSQVFHYFSASENGGDRAGGNRLGLASDENQTEATREGVFLHESGSTFPVEYIATPITEGGKISGAVVVFRNIEERLQMQSQLVQTSKLATLGTMATGIAHEINQPLNVIRLVSGTLNKLLLNDQISAKELKPRLDSINKQIQRASEIIEHIKIYGRGHDTSPELIDVNKIARGTLDFVGEQLRNDQIEIATLIPDSKSFSVRGIKVQLEQVILNLIANARDAILDHRDDTSGRIEIAVSLAPGQNTVQIAISDNGAGIDTAVLPRLFDPFYSTKEVGKGTGLGLSISFGIISEMGGTIEAQNLNPGAEFVISLPIDT